MIKYNKRIKFLLLIIDIYTNYVGIVPLKEKKDTAIVNSFQKLLDSLFVNQTWYQ